MGPTPLVLIFWCLRALSGQFPNFYTLFVRCPFFVIVVERRSMGGPASPIFGTPRSGDIRGDLQPLHFCTETTNKTKRDHDVSIYPIRRPHRDGTHFLPSTTPRDSLTGSIQIIYALRFFQKSLVRNMKLVPGYPR